jgi:hypothetical protein
VRRALIEPIPGWRRQFGDDQIERVRLVRTLQSKGVELAQLAGKNLAFPGEKYIIFDGTKLHGCPDAAAAIAAAVRAKRWVSAVDLAAIRSTLAT